MHVVFFLLKKSPEARFCLALGSVQSVDVDDDHNGDDDGDDHLGSVPILESSGHTRGWGTPSHLK